MPPPELQEDLVERIEAQTTVLDKLTKTIQRSVDRLYEVRSAIITSAVTGQIDISDWQNQGSTDRHGHAIEAETTT